MVKGMTKNFDDAQLFKGVVGEWSREGAYVNFGLRTHRLSEHFLKDGLDRRSL